MVEKEPMTTEQALKRAVFWIEALVQAGDIAPAITHIKVRAFAASETERREVAYETINLAADLREFQKLGATLHMLTEDDLNDTGDE